MRRVILIICDGFGYSEKTEFNAIHHAQTPNFDRYWQKYPHALLAASGEDIGLPDGQMGTSEANHLTIGSGRILYQNLLKINNAIKSGSLAENEALLEAIAHVKKHQSNFHIKGVISDGGVHGHLDHLIELLRIAKQNNIANVYFHLFTDGRDTAPQSALQYIARLEESINDIGVGKIASIGGRYWGMDRDNNEDRIEKHFQAIRHGQAQKHVSAREVIEAAYESGINDEFIEPVIFDYNGIKENDAMLFANFRSDRALQMTNRFLAESIDNFHHLTMTQYNEDLPLKAIFPPEQITDTLSELISRAGHKQLKVTETEKFTHLTFFFNAQKYESEPNEDRVMIPSNKDVATHDEKPEMKAKEIAETTQNKIKENVYDFIAVNLVNSDMVGHTGNFGATIKAVETVDWALGEIVKTARENNYDIIITADHGNAETLFDFANNQPLTSHTVNPVPFVLVSDYYQKPIRKSGYLHDIAPTILKMMDIEASKSMTGESFV